MRIPFTKKMSAAVAAGRRAQDLSQNELANKAGIPRASIKRIENAEVNTIEEGVATRLEKALDIELMKKRRDPGSNVIEGKFTKNAKPQPRLLLLDGDHLFAEKTLKRVEKEERPGSSLLCYRLTFAEAVPVDCLSGKARIEGANGRLLVEGEIVGVESSKAQDMFGIREGGNLVVALLRAPD